MNGWFDADMVALIVVCAIATFATRIGGYVLMSRMNTIPPRLNAALNAVPAAVLTTLVVPAFYSGGIDVKLAMAAALIASIRFSAIPVLMIGWAVVMICRHYM